MMSEFNIDDYELVDSIDMSCKGCAFQFLQAACDASKSKCVENRVEIFKLKPPKPTRESLLAEIAELDRQKEIKERELRELSNKEQGDEGNNYEGKPHDHHR